jgi:hypothetical protein
MHHAPPVMCTIRITHEYMRDCLKMDDNLMRMMRYSPSQWVQMGFTEQHAASKSYSLSEAERGYACRSPFSTHEAKCTHNRKKPVLEIAPAQQVPRDFSVQVWIPSGLLMTNPVLITKYWIPHERMRRGRVFPVSFPFFCKTEKL